MSDIKVAVNGILGRMGSTVLNAVEQEQGMTPVGGADPVAPDSHTILTANGAQIPVTKDISALFQTVETDVVVDFTNADAAFQAIQTCINHRVRCVSGSTGMSPQQLEQIAKQAEQQQIGIISASNFALGCVILMHIARTAAKHFEYADIIESHHEMKIDAPSGTALSIADAMMEGRDTEFKQTETEKETLANTRGGSKGGINIHSARMPGRVARHEVVFGAIGQTLTITHDSISRESFMPGVVIAIRNVITQKKLVTGLDKVLDLA